MNWDSGIWLVMEKKRVKNGILILESTRLIENFLGNFKDFPGKFYVWTLCIFMCTEVASGSVFSVGEFQVR